MKKNMGAWDRLTRIFVGVMLLIAGYSLLMDGLQIVVYILALALLINGVTGRCGILALFHASTCTTKPISSLKIIFASIILVLVGGSGMLFSGSISKTLFVSDLSDVDSNYEELMYHAQRGDQEVIQEYEHLMSIFESFYEKHWNHIPLIIKDDTQFTGDLAQMKVMLESVKEDVNTLNFSNITTKLEGLEDILHGIVDRNYLDVVM